MRRPAMLVALLPTLAVTACNDGPTQTVQRGCGVLGRSSTEFQLGSPVDLDTCEPDFSNRTVLVNVETAVDAIRAPVALELPGQGAGDVLIYPDGRGEGQSPERAVLRLDRFVFGEGASGAVTLVEEDGSESTIEIDAVWCDQAAGPPACD